jgi:hypothetical protein
MVNPANRIKTVAVPMNVMDPLFDRWDPSTEGSVISTERDCDITGM